eukprot:9500768-Pyramimonas_sp.AAC.1
MTADSHSDFPTVWKIGEVHEEGEEQEGKEDGVYKTSEDEKKDKEDVRELRDLGGRRCGVHVCFVTIVCNAMSTGLRAIALVTINFKRFG